MRLRFLVVSLTCCLALEARSAFAQHGVSPDQGYLAEVESRILESVEAAIPEAPQHLHECIDGLANGIYPCQGIDLLEFMPVGMFGASATNSGWGWTDTMGTPDPADDHDYYLLGLNNGTAFVDITDPEDPTYVGKLPTHVGSSNTWRDVRVYQNYAYIVSEQNGHGMQVFDLTQLRNVPSPPETFAETAHYNEISDTHTISINEETGYAYLVGTVEEGAGDNCDGNMHIVSLANPASPQFAGCYNDGGYVHENQCFVYHGPDTSCDHDNLPETPPVNCQGREICLASRGNANSLDIIDVTDHATPVRLSSLHFNNSGYSHQAWFSEDQRYVLLNDELDEEFNGTPTRTWIFDALDLDAPVLAGGDGYYEHATAVIDHNLYVRGNYVTESNYSAGLRILELTNLAAASLTEVAYFDVYWQSDATDFLGTWNHYPFFASEVIPVTHITQGLFLLKASAICFDAPAAPSGLSAEPNGPNQIDLEWIGSGTPGATFSVDRAAGGCDGVFREVASGLTSASFVDNEGVSGQVVYGYRVRELTNEGSCASETSACVEESTTGDCTEPPAFAGLVGAASAAESSCQVDLSWPAATPFCGSQVTYSVYRDLTADFVPAVENRIAQGVLGLAYTDVTAPSQLTSHYIVRAADAGNAVEDANLVRRSAVATGELADGTFVTGAELGDPPLDTLAGGDSEAPEHAGWHVSSARAHGGARSFFSTSSGSLCVSLETDGILLSASPTPELSFWTVWDMEATFDGGIVQISTNGGTSWATLTPTGGYPDLVSESGNACTALAAPPSKPAFSSTDQLTWQMKSVSLAAYAGQAVELGWRYGSDGGVNEEGWYVDDIVVTHAQVPGSCTTSAIFIERFEGGDFGAWSLVVP